MTLFIAEDLLLLLQAIQMSNKIRTAPAQG